MQGSLQLMLSATRRNYENTTKPRASKKQRRRQPSHRVEQWGWTREVVTCQRAAINPPVTLVKKIPWHQEEDMMLLMEATHLPCTEGDQACIIHLILFPEVVDKPHTLQVRWLLEASQWEDIPIPTTTLTDNRWMEGWDMALLHNLNIRIHLI